MGSFTPAGSLGSVSGFERLQRRKAPTGNDGHQSTLLADARFLFGADVFGKRRMIGIRANRVCAGCCATISGGE